MCRRIIMMMAGMMVGMVMVAGQPAANAAEATAALMPTAGAGQSSVTSSSVVGSENSSVPEQQAEPVLAPTVAETPAVVNTSTMAPVATSTQQGVVGVSVTSTISAAPVAIPAAVSTAPAVLPQTAAAPATSASASTEEEISGIDTVDLEEPEGNWLFKRLWFEKAEDRFDKIRERVGQVTRLYEGFLAKRTALDRDLFDQFYKTTGFARGELEEVLSYLMERVEDMRAKRGALQENERAFFDMLQSEQENLKKLQLDIEAINKIDNKIDDAIKELTDLLNKCRTWEGQSWQNLRQIARELSHTKAKKLFHDILTYEDNIVAVADYVEKPFAAYFDKQAQTAREQAALVEQSLKSLKERGLDFAKQAEALGLRERVQKAAAEQEEAAPKTWWGYIIGAPKALWRFGKNVVVTIWQQTNDSIKSIWSAVKGLFSEKPAAESAAVMPVAPVPASLPSAPAPEQAAIKP